WDSGFLSVVGSGAGIPLVVVVEAETKSWRKFCFALNR
ncbi:hypothetical protein NPIL_632561, partial [Nephila pilipes]